jgi:hypothetical protein
MKREVYGWIRDLHLYAGLFVSPFVLLFAASVFFLNHEQGRGDRFDLAGDHSRSTDSGWY